MARKFNRAQRQALFILAGGKCQQCSNDLGDNWEADHIEPYSKGGQTELINGQALCQKCNREKGNRMIEYRKWQARFFTDYLRKNLPNYLLVATPGGGKTFAAMGIARKQLDSGDAQLVIVVCPTDPLKKQWAKEAAKFSIQLDPNWNGSKVKSGFDGIVITYGAAINSAQFLDYLCQSRNTFVILDEIHHAGDQKAWGLSIKEAFKRAVKRLCLSGTPFRSDDNEIPFVTYQNGESVADFKYSYGDAIVDDVCRNISFPALDAEVSFWSSKQGELIESSSFDEILGEQEESQRRRAALHPSMPFIRTMLQEADKKLNELRAGYGNAGGFVVTIDMDHANSIAKLLEQVTGEAPYLVHADIPNAADLIKEYARGTTKWIVSVKMISEGIDIPRLMVGVYLSNAATELLFRQIAGRVIRRMADEDDWAFFYVPKFGDLVDFMTKIKKEVNHAIDKQHRDNLERFGEYTSNGEKPRMEIQPVSANHNPNGDVMIVDEGIYTPDYIERAHQLLAGVGIKANKAQAAILWQKFEEMKHGTTGPKTPTSTNEIEPDYIKLKKLRAAINKRAYAIAHMIAERYPTQKTARDIVKKIYYEWSQKPSKHAQDEAGLEELKSKLQWLDSQLDDPWKYIR